MMTRAFEARARHSWMTVAGNTMNVIALIGVTRLVAGATSKNEKGVQCEL